MTTETAAENTASQHTKPYRHIVAFTLVAVAGLQLLIDLVNLFLAESFRDRAASLSVVDLVTVGLPVVAVLVATHVAPVLRQGKVITLVALAELGIAGLLALLSFVMGLLQQFDGIVARDLVTFLLSSLGGFALLGIVIFFVVRVFVGEYLKSAAPAPAFGYPQQQYAGQQYPQQQYGHGAATAPQGAAATAAQAAYAQQAAYQQQAQPGYGHQYGYPQQAQPQAAQPAQQQAPQQAQQPATQQQTGYQTTATYGQSTAPTSAAPASAPPTSAAPASSPPTSAAPAYGYGAQQPAQQPAPQQEGQQAAAWPPAPPSTSQWPPTPAPKQQQQTEVSGEEVQHTQMLRPDTFRGNSSS